MSWWVCKFYFPLIDINIKNEMHLYSFRGHDIFTVFLKSECGICGSY